MKKIRAPLPEASALTSELPRFLYLRNKETQQTLHVIVSIQYDASFSANDIYPQEQYVSVKLQQVQRNYQLRNHFGIRVTSLTPVVNRQNRVNKRKV